MGTRPGISYLGEIYYRLSDAPRPVTGLRDTDFDGLARRGEGWGYVRPELADTPPDDTQPGGVVVTAVALGLGSPLWEADHLATLPVGSVIANGDGALFTSVRYADAWRWCGGARFELKGARLRPVALVEDHGPFVLLHSGPAARNLIG